MNEELDTVIDDEIIKRFNIIEDSDMRNALLDYCNKTGLNKPQTSKIGFIISLYKTINLNDLNWQKLCEITTNLESSIYGKYYGRFNLNFFRYLIENNLYKCNNMDIVYKITDLCKTKVNRLTLFDKSVKLENFILCRYVNQNKERYMLVDTKLNNKFLVELLDGFYKSKLFSDAYHNFNFTRKFVESYNEFYNFKSITDFNYQVFNKQFYFYKDNKAELKSLLKFYIYLYSLDDNLFKTTDPIDIIWMKKSVFLNQYKDGFRLIDINPMEPVPTNDKWMLRPNGQEEFTTEMNSTNYIGLDFTRINYSNYRPFVKDFFWKSTVSLSNRKKRHYHIVEFLNFIYKYKNISINKKNNIDYISITTKEILAFLSHIKNTDSQSTVNNKILCIRNFLNKDYLDNVAPMVFEFLVQTTPPTPPGGSSIPDDELKKLDKHLLKLAEDSNNDISYIHYAIFRLALDTNFRISYLLSITTDSIKEGMKKGQYYIKAVTKTSNKEKVKENISKYAHRYLDIAIKKTETLRENVSKEYEKYVFLHYSEHGNNKQVQPISVATFNKYLKSACEYICLPKYTAENIRDTSITKALDLAHENGLSYAETEILVRGKRSTKIKHYYDTQESKLFVEATYGIVIGNIDLKGQILETADSSTFSKDETVDDNCGFCKEEECRIFKEIGCPMCNFFIVTLDRIPFYERKIQQLDGAIERETIEHEREHLLDIKRLYAAYLAALYKHKNQKSN